MQSPPVSRRDVIFTFAATSWSGADQRGFSFPEDRLAQALIDNRRVERLLICDPARGLPRMLARAAMGHRGSPFPSSDTVAHHSPIRLRRDDPTGLRDLQDAYAAYERGIERAAREHGLKDPVVITANPLLAGFGDFGWAGPLTYYAWDDWSAYEPQRRWWSRYEDAFAHLRAKRRRLAAVSPQIVERIRPTGHSAVIPNGIEPSEWQRLPPPPDWFADRPAPRLLYIGSLQSRVDVDQLLQLASEMPDCSITLVGPLLEPAHFTRLCDVHNVAVHESVSRTEIAGLVGHADVGLIPHVRSPLTMAMSPLKLFEYLAGGVPVAAVDLPGNAGVSERVLLVPPGGRITDAVRHALSLGRQDDGGRLEFVALNSWQRRFDALLDVAFA